MKPYSPEFEKELKRGIDAALQGRKDKHPRRRVKRLHPIVVFLGVLPIPFVLGRGAGIARFEVTQFDDAGLSACLGLFLSLALFMGFFATAGAGVFRPGYPPFVFPAAPARLAAAFVNQTILLYLKGSLPSVLVITSIMMGPLWHSGELMCLGMILLLTAAAIALRLGLFFLQVAIPHSVFVGAATCVFLAFTLLAGKVGYSGMLQNFLNANAGWINLLHPGGWIAEIWRRVVLNANAAEFPWLCIPWALVTGSLFYTIPRTMAQYRAHFETEALWMGPASAPSSSTLTEDAIDERRSDAPESEQAAESTTPANEPVFFELPQIPEPVGRGRWIERALWKRMSERERMLLALAIHEMPEITRRIARSVGLAFYGALVVYVLGLVYRKTHHDGILVAAWLLASAFLIPVALRVLPSSLFAHLQSSLRPIQDHYPVSYQEIMRMRFRGEAMRLALAIPIIGFLIMLFVGAWTAQIPKEPLPSAVAFGLPGAAYCFRYIGRVSDDLKFYVVSFWWGCLYIICLFIGVALMGISTFIAPAAILAILLGKSVLRWRVRAWSRGTPIKEDLPWK
jgi:hypothetical protein